MVGFRGGVNVALKVDDSDFSELVIEELVAVINDPLTFIKNPKIIDVKGPVVEDALVVNGPLTVVEDALAVTPAKSAGSKVIVASALPLEVSVTVRVSSGIDQVVGILPDAVISEGSSVSSRLL